MAFEPRYFGHGFTRIDTDKKKWMAKSGAGSDVFRSYPCKSVFIRGKKNFS